MGFFDSFGGASGFGAGILDQGVSFGFNQLGNSLNSRRQYKYNKKLMNQQYELNEKAAQSSFDRSIQAWNMENEYNTPKAQMDRFQAAGLNPHLIYGQTNTAGALSAPETKGVSGGSVSGGTNPQVSLLNGINTAISIRNGVEQGNLLKAETQKRNAQIREINNRIASMLINNGLVLSKTARSNFDLRYLQGVEALNIGNLMRRNEALDILNSLRGYDRDIRRLEYDDYKNLGIRPNDPWYLRSGSRLLPKFSSSFEEFPVITGNEQIDYLLKALQFVPGFNFKFK